jgi:SAM-dependent MidA family methyltransferase
MEMAPVAFLTLRQEYSKHQARSIQQSKFLVTLTMHQRATFDTDFNAYVMRQIAPSAERLFADPAHLGSTFKFGVHWV